MKRIWTPEEEARRLGERFDAWDGKKAAFARDFGVPGGPSMVSQHISGNRPMNLASATAYAKGFGVPLEEISPRLAAEVALAAGTAADPADEAEQRAEGDDMPMDAATRKVAQLMGELTEQERADLLEMIRPRVAQIVGDRMLTQKFGVTGYAEDAKVARTIKPAPRGKRGDI